jgi:Icc-related predicted phosphoesterase
MGKAGVRIIAIDDPSEEIVYLNASSRGRAEPARLPIVHARVETLALDAIIVTSDLQGMLRHELLGIRVAEHLEPSFDPDRTGVILAGDLYCVPGLTKRGGYGRVYDVWRAFSERFTWVCGVAGNHDDMTGVAELDRVHVLDGDVVELAGLRIGGVGGIIGNKQKPGRRTEDAQLALVERVLDAGVDILVMHEGPHGGDRQPGSDVIRALVDAADVSLVICGHDHWRTPLAERDGGQILNVDSRVIFLRA